MRPARDDVEPKLTPVADIPSMSPYSPGLYPGISENAARRTPQPGQMSSMPGLVSSDPYMTSAAQPDATSTSSYGVSSGSSSSFAPYAPSASSNRSASYSNSTSYDPYAPTSSPHTSAYAPSQSISAFVPSRAGPSNLPPASAAKPAPIKRMVSNAYDPPFLRTQKSFVRPASAVASVVPALTAPSMAPSPPQPAPPAPPPGPPRRTMTDQRVPSRAPSYAAPSGGGSSWRDSARANGAMSTPPDYRNSSLSPAHDYGIAHGAAEPIEDLPQRDVPISSNGSAGRDPSSNMSFGAIAPPRRPMSASHHTYASPTGQMMVPPALAVSPAPLDQSYAPPRPASRGPSRKPSPMYETRPAFDARRSSRSSTQSHQGQRPETNDHAGYGPSSAGYPREEDERPSNIARSPYQPGSPPFLKADTTSGPVDQDQHWQGDADRTPSPHFDGPSPPNSSSYHPQPSYTSPPHNAFPPTQLPPAHDQPSFGLGLQQMGASDQHVASSSQYAQQSVYDPYAPTSADYEERDRHTPLGGSIADHNAEPQVLQMQSGSQTSLEPSPYAPVFQPAQPAFDPYARTASPSYTSDHGTSPQQANYFQSRNISDDTYVPQQVLEQKPISEDPLGRCSPAAHNIPLAVFGFGGVLVTAFPAMAEDGEQLGHSRTPSYGYASGRGRIWIRGVKDIVSPAAITPDDAPFPGPLLLDTASQKGAAGDKKKRDAVVAYLDSRVEEIVKGLPYLKSSASRARREEEGKLVVMGVLKSMVIGEGKLSGRWVSS